jgi:hypothetical protein
MYDRTTTQKAGHMLKTSLGAVLIAIIIVGVHLLAALLSTFAPIVTGVLLAGVLTWIVISSYIAIRDS